MGLMNWIQKKSVDKCRDNLIRGFPMFIEVCECINADEQRQGSANNADIQEGQRLFTMLRNNITNQSLPSEEIRMMFVSLLHNPENKFCERSRTNLLKLLKIFTDEVPQ